MLASVAVFSFLFAAASVEARTGVLKHDGHARSVELSMCDTQQPSDALLSIHSELSAKRKLRKVQPRTSQAYTIDTYLHFVVTEDTADHYPQENRSWLAMAQVSSARIPEAYSRPSTPRFFPFNLLSSAFISNSDTSH